MRLSPVQEMCWVVRRPTEGGLYTGQMLGFKSMVSLFLVHAEEGGPAPWPRQGGVMDACAALAGLSCVCGEKRGVIPAGTKQQSQQPKSRR